MRTQVVAGRWPSLAFAHDVGGGVIQPPAVVADGFPNQPVGWTQFEDNAWPLYGVSTFGVPTTAANATGWTLRDALDQDRLSDLNAATGLATLSTGGTESGEVIGTSGMYSASTCFRGRFPTTTGGNSPWSIRRAFAGTELTYKKVYIGRYLYIPSNWTNNGNAATKDAWINGIEADPLEASHNFTAWYGTGNEMEFAQSQQNNGGTGPNRDMFPNTGPAGTGVFNNYLGEWMLLEIVYHSNSANGVGDGVYKAWANNVLFANYTDVNWQMTTAGRTWMSYRFEPTYGGGPNNPPTTLFLYMDHTRMAGST